MPDDIIKTRWNIDHDSILKKIKHDHNTQPSHPHQPEVEILMSVVVPTCNRPGLLNRNLSALSRQQFNCSAFEIIVIDDSPNIDTKKIVENWAKYTKETGPKIVYYASPGPHGPAAARNFGWKQAKGEIIAFTDDDTIPCSDWLLNGMRAFENQDTHQIQAAWGRIVMPMPSAPTDYECDAHHLTNAEFVTANCFCTKAVIEQLGGFDEQFRFAWREDSDFYFRLLRANVAIAHLPHAIVEHPIRPGQWGISIRQQKKILFDALLYKKHPELYRKKIRSQPRWDYYFIVSSLCISLASAILGAKEIAIAAGSLWFFLTVIFCLMRLRGTKKTVTHITEIVVTSMLIPPLATFWRLIGAWKFRVRFL